VVKGLESHDAFKYSAGFVTRACMTLLSMLCFVTQTTVLKEMN